MNDSASARLFPTNVPDRQWRRFDAAGFSTPVSGVVFRPARAPCCGMPLGGVATGCIDVDVRGVWGFSSLFNMLYPEKAFAGQRGNIFTAPLTRKTPAYLPMLGLALGDTTWVLASREVLDGGTLPVCADPVFVDRHDATHVPPLAGVLGDPGASVAVPFALAAGEEQVLHLVLAWYAPEWLGAGDHHYTSMYARQFGSAIDVAAHMAPLRAGLLRRVLAWQQVIYAESQLPDWLQETLINNLALIPETTYWAVANPPLGDWCHQGGCFGMLESPRGCPQIECNPCAFYGNLPIVFFFPELARSQLEAYRHYQRADGAAPFVIGRWGPPDMATPGWDWQISLNGPVYAILVDRLWQRTGDVEVLHAFYQSVKKTMAFTMDLNPTPEGVISMPVDNRGMEWFEWGDQNMMLWAVPAALYGQDVKASLGAGGLIDRILAAGRSDT